MYVTKFNSGKIEVKYISAHSNHAPGPSEAGFLPLPVSIKEEIAMKLSLGISIERIMDGMYVKHCTTQFILLISTVFLSMYVCTV